MTESFRQAVEHFTETLARDVLSRIPAQPEDQLKGPVRKLLESVGALVVGA